MRKGDARRQQLLEAAIQQIIEEGIAETTIAAVAQRAGVSKGIIHYYYPDKRALLKDALLAAEDDFIAGATAATMGGPPREQLAAVIYGALPVTETGMRMQRVWFNLLATALVDAELADLQQQYHRRWRAFVYDTLERLRDAGDIPEALDPETGARVVVAFCDGMTLLLLTGSADDHAHVDANVRLFVDGLVGR